MRNKIFRWLFGVKSKLRYNDSSIPTDTSTISSDVERIKDKPLGTRTDAELDVMFQQFSKEKYAGNGENTFTPSQVEIIPQEQIKEISHFTRENNLIAEYYGEAPPISSSNLSAWEQNQPNYDPFPGMYILKHRGYVIIDYDKEGAELKAKHCIDKGDTRGFYTIEEFERRFYKTDKVPTYDEVPEDEWTGEDANKLNKVQKSEKERLLKLAQTNTHILSGFPNNNTNPHDEQRPENTNILDE